VTEAINKLKTNTTIRIWSKLRLFFERYKTGEEQYDQYLTLGIVEDATVEARRATQPAVSCRAEELLPNLNRDEFLDSRAGVIRRFANTEYLPSHSWKTASFSLD
jgi:hypothetical protein